MTFRAKNRTLEVIRRDPQKPGLEVCLCRELETDARVTAARFEQAAEAGEAFLAYAARREPDSDLLYTFCKDGQFTAVFRYTEAPSLAERLREAPDDETRLKWAGAVLRRLMMGETPEILAVTALRRENICLVSDEHAELNYLTLNELGSRSPLFPRLAEIMESILAPVFSKTPVLDAWLAALYGGEFTDVTEVYSAFMRLREQTLRGLADWTAPASLKDRLRVWAASVKSPAVRLWERVTTRKIGHYVAFRRMYVYKPALALILLALIALPFLYLRFAHPIVVARLFPSELPPATEEATESTPEPTIESPPEPTLEPTPEPTLEPTTEPTLEPEPTDEPDFTPDPSFNFDPKLDPELTLELDPDSTPEPEHTPEPEPETTPEPEPEHTPEPEPETTPVPSQNTEDTSYG